MPSQSPFPLQVDDPALDHKKCPRARALSKLITVAQSSFTLYDGAASQPSSDFLVASQQLYKGTNAVAWVGSRGVSQMLTAVDLRTGDIICEYKLNLADGADTTLVNHLESIAMGPCSSISYDNSVCV
jgi:hypothetical protein